MTAMRDRVASQLRSKLERHGVVVWTDAQGEYRGSVHELVPDDATLVSFDGSWYELRRHAEPHFDKSEPRLILYVDRPTPVNDPLAEIRAAGTEFRLRLGTLLRQTMSAELAAPQLAEIETNAATLVEAETLLAGGVGAGPATLVKALRLHEPTDILLRLATEGGAIVAQSPELGTESTEFIKSQLGLSSAPDDIEGAVARHLVMVELGQSLPALPDALNQANPTITSDQRRRCKALLRRWKHDETLRTSFKQAMTRAGNDLALATELRWADALGLLDTVPAYDDIAFNKALRLLQEEDFAAAEELAGRRLESRWVVEGQSELAGQRWQVAHAVARLSRLITSHRRTQARGLGAILRSYAERDWEIDRAQRRLEVALLALTDRRTLDEPVRRVRQEYDDWLDNYLRTTSTATEIEGLVTDDLLVQSQTYAVAVAPRAKRGPVGYFLVDALRFELGQDLAAALQHQFEGGDVSIQPSVALLPSLTSVGMANLCPGAESGLELAIDDAERLVVAINGQQVMTPSDRVTRLQAAHGQVADLRLDDIVRLSETELSESLAGANLILVRSQEIDEQGETGKLNIGLNGFDATVREISRAVARLVNRGLHQFVITADHGFISLTREIGGHMIIQKPGGRGAVHRRVFIGRGGATDNALLRLSLDRIGLPGDLDVLVPRGLALIAAGGSRGFFHGGLSPQELVVPLVTVTVPQAGGSPVLSVDVEIAPKITGHIFTARCLLPTSLLSEPLLVRPVAMRVDDGSPVALLATAGGAEQGEGLVLLAPDEAVTLGFRVTAPLRKGEKVELQVFDARTDRRLGMSMKPASVVRSLEVDDEFRLIPSTASPTRPSLDASSARISCAAPRSAPMFLSTCWSTCSASTAPPMTPKPLRWGWPRSTGSSPSTSSGRTRRARSRPRLKQKGKYRVIDKVKARLVESENKIWAELVNFSSRYVHIPEGV